jgi:hypothetical protein
MADDDPDSAAAGGDGAGAGAGDLPGPAEPDGGPQREVLSLSQLIGAPIHALVEAEAQSALATARFIRNVGFESSESQGVGQFGDLRMVRFSTTRRGADREPEEVEVAVPLLTMLPIPALQIQDATMDYVVRVVQTEAFSGARDDVVNNLGGAEERPAIDPPARLRAAFASDSRPSARRSTDMLLKMKVRIQQADMPAGLASLIRLANESVSRTPAERRPEAEDEDAEPEPDGR